MANRQNLNPPIRSASEAREMGKKGGIASGKARRARSSMAQLARQIADSPITSDKTKRTLEALGIEDEDLTNSAVVVASVFKGATSGDIKAIEKWQELTEVVAKDDKPYELPARVLGKAFVDINRNIEPNKTYIFKGGRGGLKSSFISLKIVELIKNNPDMHACVVRKVGSTLKDSVYSQMKWAINVLGLDEEFKYRTATEVVAFVNVEDMYDYLGTAPITVQTQSGITYLENFMGYRTVFLCGSDQIASGTVIAVPRENIDLYYIDPSDSDFARAGLQFTTDGETNLIGFHTEGKYSHAVSEAYAIMGMVLFAEYLNGIAVITVQ